MFYQVDPHSTLPLYAQVVEQIKSHILEGRLSAGEQLPSVRELARTLDINNLTIQKSYKLLQSEGFIQIKKGVGAFVSEEIKPLSEEDLISSLDQQILPLVKRAKSVGLKITQLQNQVKKIWNGESDD